MSNTIDCEAEIIENIPETVGRIYTSELEQDPEIIKKKIYAKIDAILEKYGYTYAVTNFQWVNGQVSANIDLVEIPKE